MLFASFNVNINLADVLSIIAEFLYNNNRLKEALIAIEKTVELNPSDVNAVLYAASCFRLVIIRFQIVRASYGVFLTEAMHSRAHDLINYFHKYRMLLFIATSNKTSRQSSLTQRYNSEYG